MQRCELERELEKCVEALDHLVAARQHLEKVHQVLRCESSRALWQESDQLCRHYDDELQAAFAAISACSQTETEAVPNNGHLDTNAQ